MKTPRVVITGLGVVSGFGARKEAFWHSLLAGQRAIAPITTLDVSGLPVREAALVPDFDLSALLPEVKVERGLTPANKFVLAAAGLALKDAGVETDAGEDIGIVLTTLFGTHLLHPRDTEALLGLPSFFVNSLPNMPAGYVSVALGLQGPQVALTAGGEASGLNAVIYGCDLIRAGGAEALLVGGYEVLSFGLLYGLCATGQLAGDGLVAGEGCGLLLLESFARARRRSARIYAEIKGYATVQTKGETAKGTGTACHRALEVAGPGRDELGAVVASTDRAEVAGLVLGEALGTVPVIAPQAALGEAFAASGAFGAIVAALAAQEARLPPAAGWEEPDSDCRLPRPVRKHPRTFNGPLLVTATSPRAASALILERV